MLLVLFLDSLRCHRPVYRAMVPRTPPFQFNNSRMDALGWRKGVVVFGAVAVIVVLGVGTVGAMSDAAVDVTCLHHSHIQRAQHNSTHPGPAQQTSVVRTFAKGGGSNLSSSLIPKRRQLARLAAAAAGGALRASLWRRRVRWCCPAWRLGWLGPKPVWW